MAGRSVLTNGNYPNISFNVGSSEKGGANFVVLSLRPFRIKCQITEPPPPLLRGPYSSYILSRYLMAKLNLLNVYMLKIYLAVK